MDNQDVYWSRTGESWSFGRRHDPVVPDPARPGPLTRDELESFRNKGFVVRESMFSPREVDALLAGADTLASTPGLAGCEHVITEPDSDAVRSIFDVHRDNGDFATLAADDRLAGAARQLLANEVYVHQSRINFKPGFNGREFFWHSDFETWHIEDGMPRMRAVSASLLLTENTALNGPLMLVPGSHLRYVRCVGETPEDHYKESLERQQIGVPPDEALSQLIDDGGIELALGPPGTVVFFDCNTMHGSTSNLTPFPRHNVFLVFNSVDNRLQAPFGGTAPRPGFLADRDPDSHL